MNYRSAVGGFAKLAVKGFFGSGLSRLGNWVMRLLGNNQIICVELFLLIYILNNFS